MNDDTVATIKEYPEASKITAEDFLKDVMQVMLEKDQDTLTINIKVDNDDGTSTELEMDVRIVQLLAKEKE